MKRKLCMKKPYLEEYIDTTKLSLGLQYLRSNHPSYTNVKPLIMSLQDALNEEKPPHLRNQDHFALKVANWLTEETSEVSIHVNNDSDDTGIQTMSLDEALTEEIQRFRQLEVEDHCQQELEAMSIEQDSESFYSAMSIDYSDDLEDEKNIETMSLDNFLTKERGNSPNEENRIDVMDPETTTIPENLFLDHSSDEEEEEIESPFITTTCLIPENPETRVIVNTSSETMKKKLKTSSDVVCEVAPGEGKVVTNYLREEDFDIAGFPRHFPDGKYGLNDKNRPRRITPQQYFTQRLLNVDKRFAKDFDFLFVAQQYVERYALERQIDVSMQKGNVLKTNDGTKVIQTKDAFSVFKSIPGTPAYWQTYRNEIFAKIEQLGPFHLFFTLSCAEAKWPEMITAILQAEGNTISFLTNPWDGKEESIHVNGIPLKEFCSNLPKTKMLMDNIVVITQMFDNRVKAFIKNIFASNPSLPIKHYSYRIEFQMRGMPHVHGIAWLDLTKDEEKTCLLEDKTFNPKNMTKLIEKWVSCELPSDNEELKSLVEEVNVHHHTHSCRKRGLECRFDFPKLPSDTTIVAEPLKADEPDREEKLKKYDDIKARVKGKLAYDFKLKEKEKLPPDLVITYDLDTLLKELGITMEDYEEALKNSERGAQVILKRKPCEAFVNNYNAEYLLAWKANIDVQLCLDTYAVVS